MNSELSELPSCSRGQHLGTRMGSEIVWLTKNHRYRSKHVELESNDHRYKTLHP